ncbi:MAG: hypothetical protein ACK51V_00165 [bacterium]|jgi:hypothetical protein
MDLATLLGRKSPYSVADLLYVYSTRDLPFAAALGLAAWWFAPEQLDSFSEHLRTAGGLLNLVLFAVVIFPLLETVFFVIFILVTPPAWYRTGSGAVSAFGRQVILSIVCGALFGALHLPSAVATISAAIGGTVMFAVLLEHWQANLRDRGIAMCWAIHVVHNALMLLLLAAFRW